jgi:hypothetical protein
MLKCELCINSDKPEICKTCKNFDKFETDSTHRQDEPQPDGGLREEIAQHYAHATDEEWAKASEETKGYYRNEADLILSKAQARCDKRVREERKRIGEWLEDEIYKAELDLKVDDMNVLYGLVQALKSGEALRKGEG